MAYVSWGEAVQSLIDDPSQQELVKACYFDDPLSVAAERFWASHEWQLVSKLLPITRGRALDLGAGRGISSYALARDGWDVTALEPDPSPLVGAEAIRSLAKETGLNIRVVSEYSEDLPFQGGSFDVINCRQALHHAQDLSKTCREIGRVLKPGGMMIATREHVITEPSDLQEFLDQHPLHHLYGGENAFQLHQYTAAIREAGLEIKTIIGPFDSAINYFPVSDEQIDQVCLNYLAKLCGRRLASRLGTHHIIGPKILSACRKVAGYLSNAPGRLYSFVATKGHE
jgi:2-polyprenyl-3-methyl-5-hydroxy-6-metoxy-1,4-benzoquinol methylase